MKTENKGFTDRLINLVLQKESRESLKDVNVTRLARKIKIPVATFHQWLTGAFPRSIEHWIKLHKYFHCDLTYLLTGIAPEEKTISNEGKIVIFKDKVKLFECIYNVNKNADITISPT